MTFMAKETGVSEQMNQHYRAGMLSLESMDQH